MRAAVFDNDLRLVSTIAVAADYSLITNDPVYSGARCTHMQSINIVRAGVNFCNPTLVPLATPAPIVAGYRVG